MAITTNTGNRTRAGERRDDGSRARDMALAPPRRRARAPEIAVGLLVIVLFALGGVLWHLRSVERVAALAVASPIERGETIEASDLQVVYVGSGDNVARLDRSESDRVVGATALIDLSPGALVTEDLVAEGAQVGEEEGVVGLALEPGQFPSFDLAPGDRVNVVRITSGESDGSSRSVVVRDALVTAVQDLAGGDRKLVSLLAAEDDTDGIAAIESASLRLVLVSP